MFSRSGWPSRSSRPATGSTAIGSISARPSGCSAFSAEQSAAEGSWDRSDVVRRAHRRGRQPQRPHLGADALLSARRRSRGTGRASSSRIAALRSGMAAGAAESSVTPSPIRIGAAAISEARAPQTATRPRRGARARHGLADQPQHGRVQRVDLRGELRRCPRSIASAYWARSLVPIERKSASAASRSASHRRGRRLDHHADRRHAASAELAASSATIARTPRSSATLATIGSMIRPAPAACTRRMARSWARSSSRPREADAHAAHAERRIVLRRQRQVGHRLVAADVERADDQRPARQRRRRCAW